MLGHGDRFARIGSAAAEAKWCEQVFDRSLTHGVRLSPKHRRSRTNHRPPSSAPGPLHQRPVGAEARPAGWPARRAPRSGRGPERRERARALLDTVGLADEAAKYPHQMFGGQQQRVALARALAIEPQVLLLDEPLSALDAKVRVQLREQIRALQTRLHITTVFVTHDQEEALSMADRVSVMRSGKIEQIDSPAMLYSNPATPFVAEFVGTMNRVPGRLERNGVAVLGAVVPVRGGVQGAPGSAVDVLVRPEQLALVPAAHGDGIVMTKTFLGPVTRVGVLLGSEVAVLVDRASADAAALELGAPVELSVSATDLMVAGPRGDDAAPTTEQASGDS
ncbi:MAG: ABC transporter ATP-binding protein [Acidimicrobiales bacterium]